MIPTSGEPIFPAFFASFVIASSPIRLSSARHSTQPGPPSLIRATIVTRAPLLPIRSQPLPARAQHTASIRSHSRLSIPQSPIVAFRSAKVSPPNFRGAKGNNTSPALPARHSLLATPTCQTLTSRRTLLSGQERAHVVDSLILSNLKTASQYFIKSKTSVWFFGHAA